MKRRRALILGLGLGAAGLAVTLPFLPPVRHRIEEEWYPAVPSLIRILKDEDRGVVQAAATALGKIGKPARAALPALQEVLDSLPGSPIAPSVQSAIEAIRE